jgi:iron complex outermembrane receptor protein/vitamin B12 transporter
MNGILTAKQIQQKTGDDLFGIIRILHEGNYSCVICNRNETRTFSKHSVIDLFNLYRKEPSFMEGALVADKVVGRAAAALMALSGVKYVYASVISESAITLFLDSNIEVEYDEKVPFIENIDQTGWCPLEAACYGVKTPEEIYPVIKSFILKQSNLIN